MPRKETVVDVLVSSPSDLEAERRTTEEVITEWNSTWSRERGVSLNRLTWETDTYPDIGEDAQDVVNRQLGDDYDIFIGILWARFGTPTRRASSGTEEEFNRALERYRADPDNVKIMAYFKAAPISVESDPEQLKQVHSFRKRLERLGLLYHKFNSTEDFPRLLRMHLSKQVQQWIEPRLDKAASSLSQGGEPPETVEDVASESEDEHGFLDMVEAGSESFEILTQRSEVFASVIQEYGDRTKGHSAELEALRSKPSEDIASRKRIIKKSAAATVELADAVENFIPDFRESYGIAMDAFGKAAALLVDFNPEDSSQVQESRETVGGLKKTLEDSLRQISDFRKTIENIPRVTTEFNRAKKRAVAALIELETEMKVGVNSSAEVELLMEDVIRKIDRQVLKEESFESALGAESDDTEQEEG